MHNTVIEINRRRIFSLEDLKEVLPIVWRISQKYSVRVNNLMARMDALEHRGPEVCGGIETEINGLVQEWQNKLEKLGAHTKGLWIADFDSGTGYFCWKYPEETILYWHKYSDGFTGRKRLEEVGIITGLASSISPIKNSTTLSDFNI
jgi:hypothetical protein